MGHFRNNVIPNVHFRKVNGMMHGRFNRVMMRTWLDQAGRKKRRLTTRRAKAAKISPRPTGGMLRPVVHPPTQRYNMKLRLGRGFTLEELKEAKIPRKLAPTIGIRVDHRRKNRCMESLQMNVERLKLYKSKLLVFPKKSGKKGVKKGDTPRSELQNVAQNTLKAIIPIPKPDVETVEARAITAEEKEKSAYQQLRKARMNQKCLGKRLKKDAAKEES
mmetsp:Transcript_91524/g.285273  ORF Transcript_91524/g.285273 Transcript_91524/m.285273 type:complete len:218 (+) Transcript_91524:89-742(+)